MAINYLVVCKLCEQIVQSEGCSSFAVDARLEMDDINYWSRTHAQRKVVLPSTTYVK